MEPVAFDVLLALAVCAVAIYAERLRRRIVTLERAGEVRIYGRLGSERKPVARGTKISPDLIRELIADFDAILGRPFPGPASGGPAGESLAAAVAEWIARDPAGRSSGYPPDAIEKALEEIASTVRRHLREGRPDEDSETPADVPPVSE